MNKRNSFKDYLMNIFFPERCLWCNGVTGFSGTCNCDERIKKLRYNPFEINIAEQIKHGLYIDNAYAIYEYRDEARDVIHRLKFEKEIVLAKNIGEIIAGKINNSYDLIVPVPLSAQRLSERGFNQSELIAKAISEIKNMPYDGNVLIKVIDTEKQSGLEKEKRAENIKNAYEMNKKELVENKTILLIDDVITTGNTANECARIIKNAGAVKCDAAAFAYTILKTD